MDTDDLRLLAGYLEKRGLQVVVNEPDMRLLATNPLNSRLSEEITATGDRYVTSFDYEIGEHGRETECAERIAQMLALGPLSVHGRSA
ncbi:hypothetical protein ACFY78_39815 [Streptomyces olindensis]|uniref:hypothetical protein n=1 Tax=Streptomyces olindensis TaxID=358823 RepID=UPI0036AC3032